MSRIPKTDLRETSPLGEPHVYSVPSRSHNKKRQFSVDKTAGNITWTIWIVFLLFFAGFILWACGPLIGIIVILAFLDRIRI